MQIQLAVLLMLNLKTKKTKWKVNVSDSDRIPERKKKLKKNGSAFARWQFGTERCQPKNIGKISDSENPIRNRSVPSLRQCGFPCGNLWTRLVETIRLRCRSWFNSDFSLKCRVLWNEVLQYNYSIDFWVHWNWRKFPEQFPDEGIIWSYRLVQWECQTSN